VEFQLHEVTTVLSTPFQEQCYIVRRRDASECVVIDPGLEPDRIVEQLQRDGLEPVAILNTHGHCDHIGGNELLKSRYPSATLAIGRLDSPMLNDPVLNCSELFMGTGIRSPAADRELDDGAALEFAGLAIRVLHLPGHSPGHVGYLIEDEPPLLFAGDVLFAGGIGRADLPGGDFDTLIETIRDRLFPLPGNTIVLPGHGPVTSIDIERRSNPWVTD